MSNEKQHKFEIGQIIYLLSDQAGSVIPAMVIEEKTVKTLDGHKISWKIAIGPQNKRREVDSNNLKGEIYTSLNEVKEEMSKRFLSFVEDLIDSASKRTKNWYGDRGVEHADKKNNNNKIDPASFINDIDENDDNFSHDKSNISTESKLDTSEKKDHHAKPKSSFKPKTVVTNSNNPKDLARQKLLEMSIPEDDDEEVDGDQTFVTMDDGRKVPVNFSHNS